MPHPGRDALHVPRGHAGRLIGHIVSFCGSVRFILLHLILFALWIGSSGVGFDPWPHVGLILCVNLESIILMSFVLMAHNQSETIDRARDTLEAREVEDLYVSLEELHEINRRQREIMRVLEDVHLVVRGDGKEH